MVLFCLRISKDEHMAKIPKILEDIKYIQGVVELGTEKEGRHCHVVLETTTRDKITARLRKEGIVGNVNYGMSKVKYEAEAVCYAIKEGLYFSTLYSEENLKDFKKEIADGLVKPHRKGGKRELTFTQKLMNAYEPICKGRALNESHLIEWLQQYFCENAKIFDEYIIARFFNLLNIHFYGYDITSKVRNLIEKNRYSGGNY